MIRNYIKTALRNLSRNKITAVVNIAGLVVGFAAFLLLFLVIQYEQSFDNFHVNGNRIFRVVRIGKDPINTEYRTGVPFPVTQGLRSDFPQLTNAGAIYAIHNAQVNILEKDGSILKKFKEENTVFAAEPQFFKMFNFKLAEGNIENALNEPNTALLTKDNASKYFGDWKLAIGKAIKLFDQTIKITGILNNLPSNTDFPLGIVISYSTLIKNNNLDNWANIADENYCFVQLPDSYSKETFDKLLGGFVDRHIRAINPGYDLALQPLKEIHYDERLGNFNSRTFSKDLIFALRLIALFLLTIACVNFINLTTAHAITRAREVGVRKVLGSNRWQLIGQFLGETGITCFLALATSIIVVFICIPFLNNLLDINLEFSIFYSIRLIALLLITFIVATFLSGLYPSFILSGFKSVNVLKGAANSKNIKGIAFRRGLVIFQFVIAQALIIGTLVVASQMNYFRNADMGFNKNAVINAGIPGDSLSHTKIQFVKNELSKLPGIKAISFSTFAPTAFDGWYTDLRIPGNTSNKPDMIVCMKPADTGYFHLYNLQILAGRTYYPSDTMREFVVNENVIKGLGIQNAKNAIGKLINVNGKTFPIVGVVHDFHTNSLRDPIGPVVLTTFKDAYGVSNIKIDLNKATTVIQSMKSIWNKNFPDYVFEYKFLDKTIADYYKQENQLSQLYKIFAAIAIFISCLGLYGLISFMSIQRKKEIGIRKVLGAPVSDIVIMLSKEFTILISIAFLIAAPIAWYFMNAWLHQYNYRIMIGVWYFVATIVSSLSLAWITVSYTAIKAAIANPVKSLRTE